MKKAAKSVMVIAVLCSILVLIYHFSMVEIELEYGSFGGFIAQSLGFNPTSTNGFSLGKLFAPKNKEVPQETEESAGKSANIKTVEREYISVTEDANALEPDSYQEPEAPQEEMPQEELTQEMIWHFYNLDLQDNEDKLNDYNFGPNPILENVSLEKVKEAIKGKKVTDTIKIETIIDMLDAYQVKEDQLQRMHADPKLGAADMAWMDSIAGTRYLGTFYSAAKEQWDVAMNDAADAWIEDEESYYQTLLAYEKWLDSATDVRIEYRKSGLTDQMYMNPYTVSGIPDIIVMETTNHDGWFIVYEFTIKTKTIEVAYRIDCGYQPTNVSKIMKITPKANPNNKTKKSTYTPTPSPAPVVVQTPTPTPTNPEPEPDIRPHPHPDPDPDPWPWPWPDPKPDPEPEPKPEPQPEPQPEPKPEPQPEPKPEPQPEPQPEPKPEPKPEPEPDPDPVKDPTQGTQVLPNDDPGPGPDTNNGVGATTSTEEKPTNSTNMSQEEYKETIEELKEANEISREAGEPNTPSYDPKVEEIQVTEETSGQSSTTITVDNNADTGNPDSPGSTSIDTPTPVQDSSVADDSPGEAWDGPPDA